MFALGLQTPVKAQQGLHGSREADVVRTQVAWRPWRSGRGSSYSQQIHPQLFADYLRSFAAQLVQPLANTRDRNRTPATKTSATCPTANTPARRQCSEASPSVARMVSSSAANKAAFNAIGPNSRTLESGIQTPHGVVHGGVLAGWLAITGEIVFRKTQASCEQLGDAQATTRNSIGKLATVGQPLGDQSVEFEPAFCGVKFSEVAVTTIEDHDSLCWRYDGSLSNMCNHLWLRKSGSLPGFNGSRCRTVLRSQVRNRAFGVS